MAGSTSGQDEANPVFWLAIRAGKMCFVDWDKAEVKIKPMCL